MGRHVFAGRLTKRPEHISRCVKTLVPRLGLVLFALALVAASPPAPQRATQETELEKVTRQAVKWLSEYVKINTTNPPGGELPAARYLRQILQREGIACRTVVSEPGRANFMARIAGRNRHGGVALVHHMDVVPVASGSWTVPPFSGLVRDGYVWGRGVLDSKGLGVVHLAAIVALKRSGRIPERDVILLAVADEETGGRAGMKWIVEEQEDWLRDIEYALTEGGANIVRDDRLAYVGLENTQKLAVWLRLTAGGEPSHGSYLNREAASHRLVRALDRLLRYQPGIVITPAVSRYLHDIAAFQAPETRERFLHLEELRKDPDAVRRFDPVYQALLRNTIAVTVISAGNATNSLSGTALAEVDCRLVPTQDPHEFIETVIDIVGDSNVVVEPVLITSSPSSPLGGELFEAIRTVTHSIDRQAVVGSAVLAGFTDARFLRERDIVVYGFDPFKASNGNLLRIHGTDERVAISDLEFAIHYLSAVVSELAFSPHRATQPNGVTLTHP